MNFNDFNYFLLLRLLAAAVLGSLIGLERGRKNHEAGLRTHIVLCLGAASVMVVSECIGKQYGSGDIMRMGAQVISGVGFLGAGSIITNGNRVKGITTAAGLWTTACVGIAAGSGYYIIAATVVALMLFAMLGLHSVSAKLESKSLRWIIKVDLNDRFAIKEVLKTLMNEGAEINSVKTEGETDNLTVTLDVKFQKKSDMQALMSELTSLEGVREFGTVQMTISQ